MSLRGALKAVLARRTGMLLSIQANVITPGKMSGTHYFTYETLA
jgi:hypothetical protein